MPPSHARAVLSTSIRCNACANNGSVARRSFASSPVTRTVGPESPRFIDVPKPREPSSGQKPIVKGSLPVPRNIFVNRSDLNKESEEFLKRALPEPSATAPPTGPHADRLAWEQRLSALRRRNYREGVASLYKRKQRMDEYLARRGTLRQQKNLSLVKQPARDDEVFTNPSVSKTIRDFLDGKYYTVTKKSIEKKMEALRRREASKSEERKKHLHALYLHAQEYIVTEEQLSTAIEDTFGTDDNLPGFAASNSRQGASIWARGQLLNTAQMLASNQGRSDRALNKSTPEHVTQKRIHQIAEELTGGKIAHREDIM